MRAAGRARCRQVRRRKDLDTGLKEEEEQEALEEDIWRKQLNTGLEEEEGEQLNPSFVDTPETFQVDRSGQELHFREVGSCTIY